MEGVLAIVLPAVCRFLSCDKKNDENAAEPKEVTFAPLVGGIEPFYERDLFYGFGRTLLSVSSRSIAIQNVAWRDFTMKNGQRVYESHESVGIDHLTRKII